MITEILLYLFLLVIAYTYIGYPVLLLILARLFPSDVNKVGYIDSLSVIISAHNEGEVIYRRLLDLYSQDYPRDQVEVILISDGSVDNTIAEVERFIADYPDFQIKLIEFEINQGKPAALNKAVSVAAGNILLFTDSRQEFEANVFAELVSNFSDPAVGCVSGELFFRQSAKSKIKKQMGLYWNYEKAIRKMESKLSSVVGVTGAIYALRRELYEPIPNNTLTDDLLIPLKVSLQGRRVIFDGDAVAYDTVSDDEKQEWRRKIRTLTGNWQLLFDHLYLFNPFRNKILLQLISHKVLRLVVPFCMIGVFVSSLVLANEGYLGFFMLQVFFYLLMTLVYFLPKLKQSKSLNFAYFFVLLNVAVMVSLLRILFSDNALDWGNAHKEKKDG